MRGRPKQRDENESKLMDTMITANRLSDGIVVFQDADGGWSEDFHRGAVFSDEGAKATALARAEQSEAGCEVVGPYAIEIESRNGHFVPKALREAIRASGPTIRRDLGKQAHGQAPSIVQHASVEISHVSL
jgi:hypothetical protein